MRSDTVKKGLLNSPKRSLFYSMGYNPSDLEKPIVGIVNSYSEIVPGHIHLDKVARAVKDGVFAAGGLPLEFSTVAVCDGLAMRHYGMKFSLASREIIADSIEAVVEAHCLDALVFIPNCDKIVPGMLIAAARLNLPSIIVSGGPMQTGKFKGRNVTGVTLGRVIVETLSGRFELSEEERQEFELAACPGCGACAGMFTANSMNCITEVMGLALPWNGTAPAVMAHRYRLARESGTKVMELLKSDIRPSHILSIEAFYSALAVDMALGCSTNTLLHLPAIAHEVNINIEPDQVNAISRRTPRLCSLSPSGDYHVEDLYYAGGVQAVLKELYRGGLVNGDLLTVSGELLKDNFSSSPEPEGTIIKPLEIRTTLKEGWRFFLVIWHQRVPS